MVEWQTPRFQAPLLVRASRFKSGLRHHDSIAINIAENSLFKFRNISNEDPYVSGHSFSYCVLLPWYYSFANEWYPNVERSFSYWFTHVCYGSNSFQWFIFDS